HEGIERLRDWPREGLETCRLFTLPEQASLDAVAAYEPEQPFRGIDAKEVAYPIDLRVEKPGDIVLVLNTYRPASWRVSASAARRIVGVVLIGYHASKVEGLAPDTPVMSTDIESLGNDRAAAPACIRMRSGIGGAYRGGPDALVFDRQVQALTGRGL